MEFVIENEKLVPAINLLGKLSLKGKKSRHRTKMIKDLMEGVKEFEDQRQLIIKEHCNSQRRRRAGNDKERRRN